MWGRAKDKEALAALARQKACPRRARPALSETELEESRKVTAEQRSRPLVPRWYSIHDCLPARNLPTPIYPCAAADHPDKPDATRASKRGSCCCLTGVVSLYIIIIITGTTITSRQAEYESRTIIFMANFDHQLHRGHWSSSLHPVTRLYSSAERYFDLWGSPFTLADVPASEKPRIHLWASAHPKEWLQFITYDSKTET